MKPDEIRVFVNEAPQTVRPGAVVRDALRIALPELLLACECGEAFVADGRGLPLALDEPLLGGAILRVARSSRRTDGGG